METGLWPYTVSWWKRIIVNLNNHFINLFIFNKPPPSWEVRINNRRKVLAVLERLIGGI